MAKKSKAKPVRGGKSRVKVPAKMPINKKKLPPPNSDSIVVKGQVRDTCANPMAGGIVRGTITRNDTPVECAIVEVHEKAIRGGGLIERTETREEGTYEIHYRAEQLCGSRELGTNLFIRVVDENGETLGESDVHFNVEPEETIDLVLPSDLALRTEYRVLLARLTPLLEDVPRHELKEEEVQFLARKTGFNSDLISHLVGSAQLHHEAPAVPEPVFYGLLRQDLPAKLPELMTQDLVLVREMFERSARAAIVPSLSSAELDTVMQALRAVKAQRTLTRTDETRTASLGDLFKVARLAPEKSQAVAELYVEHGGVSGDFMHTLDNYPDLSRSEADAVRFAVRLGELTKYHLPLVVELQRRESNEPASHGHYGKRVRSMVRQDRGPAEAAAPDLRELAGLDVDDWKAILKRPQPNGQPIGAPPGTPGDNDEERLTNYATSLADQIEAALPTPAIAARVAKDTAAGSPFRAQSADLQRFFENNPDFEFGSGPVDLYLQTDRDDKLEGVTDPAALVLTLGSMSRVFNVANKYREMRAVLADDLHSAAAMVHMGRRAFVEKYADPVGSAERAEEIFRTAEIVHNTALTLFLDYSIAARRNVPYVMGGEPSGAVVPAPPDTGGPTWSSVFGTLDLCDCEHCKSLYSPAAYFVDIMRFLADGPSKDDRNPLTALLDRRPDLEHIELTCENTQTPLPYVDLAKEILEASVVPRTFEIAEGADITAVLANLRNSQIPTGFPPTFATAGFPLTSEASVRLDRSGRTTESTSWIILDAGWAFLLKHQGQFEGFKVFAWPQTSWTAAELRAQPEHTHDPAYTVLRDAAYPWNLPLNLPIEEMRTYLAHLGVPRHEFLSTFYRPGTADPAEAWSSPVIANEQLGLTPEGASLITHEAIGTTPLKDIWTCYGLQQQNNSVPDPADGTAPAASGDWDVVLSRASIFLRQSGLRYEELLELLGTRYVNPVIGNRRTLEVRAADPKYIATCALSKLQIAAVDQTLTASQQRSTLASAFDRIHRFVRLWRTLKWTARDLDKAITAFKPVKNGQPDLTSSFLVQMSHVERVRSQFNLPLVQIFAWWADIDVDTYLDHLKDDGPPVPSLYATLFSNRAAAGQSLPADSAALTGSLDANAAAIIASIRISADEFALLHANPNVVPRLAGGVLDDSLTLGNLSRVYRHAAFARALKYPIRAYLSTLELIAADPFATTSATLEYLRQIETIRRSGFSVEELDYLLRHQFEPASRLAITDEEIVDLLDVLRADLRAIAADQTFVEASTDPDAATSDPQGDLTRQRLALLNWDTAVIDQIVAVLNDTFTFSTTLAALPPAVVIPQALVEKVVYDAGAQQLRCTGTMSSAERTLLTSPPNTDAGFVGAVGALFNAPREFIRRHMRRYSVPSFETRLTAMPTGVRIADVLKAKCYFDAAAERLRFVGVMTEAERGILKRDVTDTTYRDAIDTLFNAPANVTLPASDAFITTAGLDDIAALFASAQTDPQERFLLVLRKLMPYLKATLSQFAVTQRVSEGLELESISAQALLTRWITASTPGGQRALADFMVPAFAGGHANVASSGDAFPHQFKTLRRLHKVSVLSERFGLTPRQLGWLFDVGAGRWLDLNALPLDPAGAAHPRYLEWARLADVCRLRDTLPDGEWLLSEIFARARTAGTQLPALFTLLRDGVGWAVADLTALSDATAFNLSAASFATETVLVKLAAAFRVLKKLGAAAAPCLTWTRVGATYAELQTAARDIRSLVRARLDASQWLEVAKALHDPLRERQRSALVSYLVAQRGLRDADELYADLLIDVQMSPCMMTSRIKQAINTIQLFVQRSLMNLEEHVALTPVEAKQWLTWQKQGSLWEANRKVLLYPENWIEPDLRDDKSPFFKELEDELLQNDVTAATAEDAFLHYIEKLDQVARLDVVGMYRHVVDSTTTILHVIGRTHGTPHVYFYRCLEDTVWTAWERIDLDIEGDHLMPVVWNRRLHLFWATFTEKTDPPTKSEREKNQDPGKYWDIQCASSVLRNGKWVPKKISKGSLRHDKHPNAELPQQPRDFSFKTRVHEGPSGSRLSIQCYGTKTDVKPAVTVTNQVTTNFQYIEEFYQHKVLDLVAPYYMVVQFQVDRDIPRQADRGRIKVNVRPAGNTTALPIPLTLDSKGETVLPGGARYMVTDNVWCELESDAFQVYDVSDKWERFSIPGTLGITVQLRPWVAPDPTTTTVTEEQVIPLRMQGLGEFALDDANGDLVAYEASKAYVALSPTTLVPIGGTGIQSMAMVESNTSNGGLGVSRILEQTPGRAFRILLSHDAASYAATYFSFPFFFQDDRRTYIVSYVPATNESPQRLHFETYFHPRVPEFMRSLNRLGIDGLLTLDNQRLIDSPSEFKKYSPGALVDSRLPKEDVDFTFDGAYSLYNWELFFHTPYLIAIQLMRNQRFAEAQKWFHYIFNPTATDSPDQPDQPGPERFWRVKPFYDEALGGIETLEEQLADESELADQVRAWAANPYKPHVIARMRKTAYMKAVVMRYLDNLIAWGDQLFRRDTIESINEATQLYVLAAQILGKKPERIPPRLTPQLQTFRTLDDYDQIDSLSNAVVAIEGLLPPATTAPATSTDDNSPSGRPLTMPFFCLTPNDKLLGYWETVADRLFKIRHCMNIEGVVRELPLFDPPIDPGLLVRAAAGVDISSALADINAPVPHYRFRVMLQKASELCGEVKALGGALLSAIEKRDAEALALLRSSHEVELLKAVRTVKERQVEEAEHTLQGLMKFQDVVTARQEYYNSRPFLNTFEMAHLGLTAQSLVPMSMQAGAELLGGILHLIPGLKMGAPTTIGATYGGDNVGPAAQAFGSVAGTMASMMNTAAGLSATLGSHERRQDDWTHQADLATKELEQVKKQIAGAGVRVAIAEQELKNHDLQAENTKAAHEFMRDKFTNQELYNWMVGQIAGIYFQSYQLAYDVCKRVERTFRHELALKDSAYVRFGHWDSLKKGLLAGERLHHDLHRMDIAYLEQNRREYEITKHVSLNALDPISVLKLKQTGECFVHLPETIFDLDYPGHYLRRLKTVSITIPCVVGPYASVNCTLTQHNSMIRHANTLINNEHRRQGDDDPRFTDAMGATQAIVTSGAQNDSGLFEANLGDERYLPFEGKGAIGTWRLQVPREFPAFDHETISDVILHVRYTAREGGDPLRKAATDELSAAIDLAVQSAEQQGLARSFSLRQEFPSDWHRFLNPPAGQTGDQAIKINIEKARFPFLLQSKPIALTRIRLFLKLKPDFVEDYIDEGELNISLQPGTAVSTMALTLNPWKGLVRADLDTTGPLGDWTLAAWRQIGGNTAHVRVDPAAIEDIVAVCGYTISM